MQRRLQTARDEVAAFTEYDYVVVNDELDSCVDRLRAIVLAERARLAMRCRARPRRSSRRFVKQDGRLDSRIADGSSSSWWQGPRAQLLDALRAETIGQREARAAGAEGSPGS